MGKTKLKNWLEYYRACLIDTSRGNKKTLLPNSIVRETYEFTTLSKKEVKEIWDKDKVFSFHFGGAILEGIKESIYFEEDIEVEFIGLERNGEQNIEQFNKIEIAPIFIKNIEQHTKGFGDKKNHYPYWIPAYIRQDGILFPPQEGELPTFLRKYLSPSPKDTPTIAEMEKLDTISYDFEFNRNSWSEYWKDCEIFFKKVTGKKYSDFQQNNIIKFSLCKYEDVNSIKQIISLYNHLIQEKVEENENYILKRLLDTEPVYKIVESQSIDDILVPNHYGHMSEEFPLSKSQREAFAKFQYKEHSDIFAINGPPGTGKTTILQSFIANSIVNAILDKAAPPLIVGCSTNNQAITNILDSMKLENKSNDISQERWLPGVSSFGLYLAASYKTEEELKDYQYTKNYYFEDGFASQVDINLDIKEYEKYFIKKYSLYVKEQELNFDFSKEIQISEIKTHLKSLIDGCKQEIDDYIDVAKLKYAIPEYLSLKELNSEEEILEKIKKIKENKTEVEKLITSLKNCIAELEKKYKSFPLHIRYLSFSKYKKIRENAFKLILKKHLNLYSQSIKYYNYYDLRSITDQVIFDLLEQVDNDKLQLTSLNIAKDECEKRNYEYAEKINQWNKQYAYKWENLIDKTQNEYQNLDIVEDMAVKLDISLRHKLFWLCVHYREVEFIKEQSEREIIGKRERSMKTYRSKLQRLAKITPLFISTFHSLPKYCTYYSYEKKDVYYKNLFDLMIVDEAGQVSPEIAMPSFTFTKKLLTVGDIYQIEPIWGISESIDYKNAEKYKLVITEDQFLHLKDKGYLASSGSVMKLALYKSHFSYKINKDTLHDGVLLKEHRRCLDPIINYSNTYVYHNSLILKGGKVHNKTHKLPPLGYIHINGFCEKHLSSSRNIVEARTIILWLKENKIILEEAYKKSLENIVAIVTPYSAQKEYIKELIKLNFSKDIAKNMIVGTVHSLQGAERAIIIFSPTNSDPRQVLFMDYGGKVNMLNVAVTRAKHCFLVFGNMTIFKRGQNTASSYLAELLYSSEDYILDDTFVYKNNTIFIDDKDEVKHLISLIQHRKALEKCFALAEKELIICSPFISVKALYADNVIEHIKNTLKREVKITILTDEDFDKENGSLKSNALKGRRLLKESGVNLIIYKGIHNKTICVDDKLLIEGSFNWLSASRNIEYLKQDNSLVLLGVNVKTKVKHIKEIFGI